MSVDKYPQAERNLWLDARMSLLKAAREVGEAKDNYADYIGYVAFGGHRDPMCEDKLLRRIAEAEAVRDAAKSAARAAELVLREAEARFYASTT